MFDDCDAATPRAAVQESLTHATTDSLTRKNSGRSSTSSRRGTKKDTSKNGMLSALDDSRSNMEASLSDLFSFPSKDQLHSSGINREGATVGTVDSMARKNTLEKSFNGNASQKISRRGGKKSPNGSDLEKSLSDLLLDDEEDERGNDKPQQGMSVMTKDSIVKEKSSESRNSSKRGGRKLIRSYSKEDLAPTLALGRDVRGGGGGGEKVPSLHSSLGRLGGPKRDFGRQADDNDTFCGMGTVGEKELQRGSPHGASSPTKTKISMPMRTKTIVRAMPSPFMNRDEDSDSDDEDLFKGFSGANNNPFRMPV